ncbi:MAG: TetR/AcrR family transcriptional regulator [Parvularculaceae bacterium]
MLVEQGYPRLTMRNVAERAGISVGNLNYYFANKQDLLRELLQAIIQGYVEDFSQIIHDKDRAAIDRFESVVRFIMGDLETRETTGFFPALLGARQSRSECCARNGPIYDVEKGSVLADLIANQPDLSEIEVNILALFVMGAIEGQTVFVGFKRKNSELLP